MDARDGKQERAVDLLRRRVRMRYVRFCRHRGRATLQSCVQQMQVGAARIDRTAPWPYRRGVVTGLLRLVCALADGHTGLRRGLGGRHPSSTAAINAAPVRRDFGPPSSISAPAWAGRSALVPAQRAGVATGTAAQPISKLVIISPVNSFHGIVYPFACLDFLPGGLRVLSRLAAPGPINRRQHSQDRSPSRDPSTKRAE